MEWVGIAHSTKPDYMKGASDLTIRNRLLLAMLKKRGRYEMNQSGDKCIWQLEYSQPPVEAYADGGVIDFSNHDAFRQVVIDWRGYQTRDSLTMKQRAMNKGENALINLFQTKANRLNKSLSNKFAGELYRDGSAAGRESAIHGLETFLAAGSCTSSDRIAAPNDTYGETALSTVPGNQGGAWTAAGTAPNASLATDWPDGSGDSEYDFNSPKLVNWSANSWGTSSTSWEDNCWRVIGQTITWLTITGGNEGTPDIFTLAGNLFQGYKNHEETIRRINVPHKEAADLGFTSNVLNQDGVAIHADFDCPVNTGYGLVLNTITVSSLMPDLFWMEGPDIDPRSGWSYLWGQGFWGNVKYSPKHVAKLRNFA